jgi:diguanylate cyclase (GGDEF)-like protein
MIAIAAIPRSRPSVTPVRDGANAAGPGRFVLHLRPCWENRRKANVASLKREVSLLPSFVLRGSVRWLDLIGRPGAIALAVAAAATAVYFLGVRGLRGPLDPAMAELWVLFLVFVVAELYVADARDRSELVALSPHEAGLVLGLFLLAPNHLVVAQLAGAAVALGGVSLGRLRLSAVLLRIATLGLGTCLALVVFHAILRDTDHTGPLGWVAAIVAASVAAATTLGVGYISRRRDRQDEPVLVTAAITAGASLASSSIALAAVALARNYDVATILLIVPFAACAVILRAYASERMRLKHLRTLYESMRTAQRTTGLDDGVAELLGTTRRLVRAEVARLVLFPRNGSSTLVASMTPARHEPLQPTKLTEDETLAVRAVAESGSGVLISTLRAPQPQFDRLLTELGLREAMLTPLRVESEIRGVLLVGDRANAERFRIEHLRLFETYAGHAGVLIENDRLEESLSELTELKDQLRHQAFHDALTGLPNRMLFAERVGRSLGDGEVDRTAVLFLDLDDFKTINDSLGHYVGDELLIAVARRVEACIRPIDLPARLGGDEFAVLLRHAGVEEAQQIAERLVRSIEQPFVIDKRDITIHASVGIALGGPDASAAEELLRNADVAMYDAKREGKRGFVTYEPEMHTRVRERQELAFAIERAVERGEIGVHYQPIVDLEHRTLVAFEALARWNRPGHGILGPGTFIPLADELGYMVEIGRAVLREACRQARSWELAYPNHEGLTVNVNLAPSELQNPDLSAEVAAVLEETQLKPERLAFEITESGVMRNPEVALQTMRDLRELGVALGLDDFGTGHSSLAYLREFPLDSLKIARPFVAGLPEGELDAVFVEAIVRLATSLGLEVVAEGIESAAQCQAVAALGCTHAQGFYFGEPLAGLGVSSYLWAPSLPAGDLLPLVNVA